MIRDEETRLRRAFRPLLLLTLTAPALVLYACSSSSDNGASSVDGGNGDGSGDSTLGSDSPGTDDSGDDGTSGNDGTTGRDGSLGFDAAGDGRVPVCVDGFDASHPPFDGAAYLEAGDDGSCDFFFEYTGCTPSTTVPTGPGCYFGLGQCTQMCGFIASAGCFVTKDNCTDFDGGGNYILDASHVIVDCTKCLGGRRPEGMPEAIAESCSADDVGAWFARLAHLEGASIAAFRTLRAELVAHGAPAELVAMASRSAKDEVRHTRVTARIARRFGARPRLAKVRRGQVRSLEALAVENAAEGCVRETFGALLAAYQAEHAEDGEVRREMERIAADETRHAALAWAVARWADARLDDAARARVADAKARAVEELRREVGEETPRALVRTAGLPTARTARALVDGAAQALWS